MPIPPETTNKRPECCTFAFGHMFYGLDSTIYFSQLLDPNDFSKIGKCHSINDPTAEEFNSPLDTDGGVIRIAEAAKITRIERLGPGIVAFAANGIWYIGGPDSGWKPTSFSVDRVSENGIVSRDAVVLAENSAYYWSFNGIHRMALNEFNVPVEQSITDASIKEFYQAIPGLAKQDASGCYDGLNKQVCWTYFADAGDFGTISSPTIHGDRADRMTSELIYDIRLDAWYPQEYRSFTRREDNSPTAFSISHCFELAVPSGPSRKKYIRVSNGLLGQRVYFGFALINNSSFFDGDFENTIDNSYPSYLETAYEVLGNPANRKATQHVFTFFNKTETAFVDAGDGTPTYDFPSGCNLTIKWDWNLTIGGNKWFDAGQVYRFRRPYFGNIGDPIDDGESVIQTKTKLRGTGKAMSLRFDSEGNKDFQLLGFSVNYDMAGKF